MTTLKGNCVLAQSGGPTTVINSSVCGAVQEAMKHADVITGIFGSDNGILGILQERMFDLGREPAAHIQGLRSTPSAALGSCRYKLRDLSKSREDYERIVEVFKAHNIRYFFYAGGNDSMDTCAKVCRLARETGYDMIAVGIAKTIDNDLAFTDHCPGFGSVVKYNACAVMEAGKDTEAMYTADTVTVQEIMGRNAGWIAAGTGMARRTYEDAPHLIYVPEVPFTVENFVRDVKEVLGRLGYCVIAAGEGMRDSGGKYLSEMGGSFGKDSFGHAQLGGAAEILRAIVESEVKVKCRTNKLGTCQRQAMHFASLTDVNEAYACGQAAVQAALRGISGKMVTLVRESEWPKYKCTTGLADLSAVANGEKKLPREFLDERGTAITDAMKTYLLPLLQGEAPITIGTDGLPVYVRLEKHWVPPKTGRSYVPGKK
jgi:ATP-dependent phosphofructokinase / diphosphate-dependent phosphofructokinase